MGRSKSDLPPGVTTGAHDVEAVPCSQMMAAQANSWDAIPARAVTPDGPAMALWGKAHACRMLAKRSHLKNSGYKKATLEGGC